MRDPRLLDRGQQGILAVQQQWLEYELAGNIPGVVSSASTTWSGCLRMNRPCAASAVAAWLAVLPEHRIRRIEITNVQIHRSGGLAYKLADFTTWFEDAGREAMSRSRAATCGFYGNHYQSTGR